MVEKPTLTPPEEITPEILESLTSKQHGTKIIDDPTDYENTKAMMLYLFQKLDVLRKKTNYTAQDYSELFKVTSKLHSFKSDKVLLVLLSRSVAFYCTEYRKKLSFSKKQLLMQFVMIIQKILSDRKVDGI